MRALFFGNSEEFGQVSVDSERAFSDRLLEHAFTNHSNDIQVQGSGTVVKILADDLQGSKHQQFIVKVTDNLTILISHNIDLAPRIDALSTGEHISFSGEYVWNKKGGLVHWTHHDPSKRHPDGWLKYQGMIYQ
ncbi:MAG: DUF3465 domain-containing protein [Desulfobulbaceae bacterium]|nr:DUF3465 domain-containing protein [Desulfobulbaceae bacterium]